MEKNIFNLLIFIILSSFLPTTNLQAQDCLPPSYSTVTSITDNSAIISWRDNHSHNSWNIVISPNEIEDPSTVDVTANVTGELTIVSYTAQGLSPETEYHYYIQAHCGENNNSTWISGVFLTRCAEQNIPYTENFNTYESTETSFPDCWTKMQGTSFTTYTDAEHVNTLQVQKSTAVALPTFSLPINTLRIQFQIMASNTNTSFEVGMLSNIDNMSTYTTIETINLTSTYTFFDKTVNFSNYTGSGRYIVLRNTSTSNYYVYIDNVTVSVIPDCLSPINVQADNIQASSATLTWEEAGTATQWQTILSNSPITNFNTQNPSTSTSTSYSANNLMPNTTYYFYVRSICSSDYSEWSEISFTTPCSASSLPASESFSPNQVPTCWSRTRVIGNADVNFVGYGNNPYCNPIDGNAMVQWGSANNGSGWQARLVSLPLNTTGTAVLDVNFNWNHDLSNSNGLNDGVQIQYSTDGITWTNSTQGMIYRYDGVHNGWTEYDIIVPEAGNLPKVYVGFLFNAGGGGANCYLDAVNFRAANGCFTPVNVEVTNINGNNATIIWDEVGSASTWNVLLSETPITDFSNVNPVTVSSQSYLATNLNPSSLYYVYVRSKCSANSFSEWTPALTFTSGCGDILTIPYSESFDDYGTCTDAFPPCWMRHGQPGLGTYFHNGQTCYTPSATDIAAIDGDKSLMVCTPSGCYTYTITPPIQEDIHNLAVTFFLLKSAETNVGTFEVGVMSNANDPATFETVATIEPPHTGEWNFYPISFTNTNISGSGKRIAFRHHGIIDNNYYLVDGLTIMEAPDCWHATNISVQSVTGNSATLSWMDPNEPSAQWRVKISDTPISDFTQTANVLDQIISDPTVTIDYLLGGTTYHYYIQSVCSDNTSGTWEQGTFTTLPCNCYVDIYMNDQWANTWEGAKIQMKHGTTVFAEVSMTYNGSHDTARVYTCEAQNIDYYFVSGNYDSDISFTIVNSLGTTLYTSSGTPVAGCFYSGVPACGVACGTAPSNLNASASSEGNHLTWEAAPEALCYTIYRDGVALQDYITDLFYLDNAGSVNNCYTVSAQCIVGESGMSNESCITGIDDRDDHHSVSIFPNPTDDRFTISADFPFTHVSVVNTIGQVVLNKDVIGNHTEINVSQLPEGIYLVKILDGKNWIVRKIIVE